MSTQSKPQLARRPDHKYHCANIPVLHEWLETHGYQFYGQHDPDEYGRFSRQESQDHGDHHTFVHSFIKVMSSGEVYSPDPLARELLDSLLLDSRELNAAS